MQACARQAGFHVDILYTNMRLAAEIGVETYSVLDSIFGRLAGEWLFAQAAHGIESSIGDAIRIADPYDISAHPDWKPYRQLFRRMIDDDPDHLLAELKRLREYLPDWITRVGEDVVGASEAYQIVGCSTSFDQTNASLVLLREIRRRVPSIVTIIGGSNCEGEMAEGIASLDPSASLLDYIFAGECEATFVQFLEQVARGHRPNERIIRGQPCRNLEALPTPDWSQFYEQLQTHLSDAVPVKTTRISYETSRGCWWGQKHHCTFCGLNGQGMSYRQKSPERVMRDLEFIAATYPAVTNVGMADNIMPHNYFRNLLPRLAERNLPLRIFYEQKANISLRQMRDLKAAGIDHIQPGIEALSTDLLKRMKKGVSASQNLALLRFSRSLGVRLEWSLLWAFPGDEAKSYEETLAILPLLIHLQPPSGFGHLVVERFSPHFDQAEHFGISNIRPMQGYTKVFPRNAAIDEIAYHFVGEYECGAHDNLDVIESLRLVVDDWCEKWEHGSLAAPALRVRPAHPALGGYVLSDTRCLPGTKSIQWIDERRAGAALSARSALDSPEVKWALENRVGVMLDEKYVPLATASAELLSDFIDVDRPLVPQFVELNTTIRGMAPESTV